MACPDCAEKHDAEHGTLADTMRTLVDAIGERNDDAMARYAAMVARPEPVVVRASNRLVVGNLMLPWDTRDPVLLVPAARDRLRVTITAENYVSPGSGNAPGYVNIFASPAPVTNRSAISADVALNDQTGYMLKCVTEGQPIQFHLTLNTSAAIYANNVGTFAGARIDYIAEFIDAG